eukprot:TRINITY_DN1562_c0_g2_i2.p1 TRINITY_DN1562_c0_g2~~TRINITY_DN1562_c0_g2_i2.p1  ORF type:complete len:708 (-),score=149.67 TRINITY_DN1562_c0_g2_i2:836-2959(-)
MDEVRKEDDPLSVFELEDNYSVLYTNLSASDFKRKRPTAPRRGHKLANTAQQADHVSFNMMNSSARADPYRTTPSLSFEGSSQLKKGKELSSGRPIQNFLTEQLEKVAKEGIPFTTSKRNIRSTSKLRDEDVLTFPLTPKTVPSTERVKSKTPLSNRINRKEERTIVFKVPSDIKGITIDDTVKAKRICDICVKRRQRFLSCDEESGRLHTSQSAQVDEFESPQGHILQSMSRSPGKLQEIEALLARTENELYETQQKMHGALISNVRLCNLLREIQVTVNGLVQKVCLIRNAGKEFVKGSSVMLKFIGTTIESIASKEIGERMKAVEGLRLLAKKVTEDNRRFGRALDEKIDVKAQHEKLQALFDSVNNVVFQSLPPLEVFFKKSAEELKRRYEELDRKLDQTHGNIGVRNTMARLVELQKENLALGKTVADQKAEKALLIAEVKHLYELVSKQILGEVLLKESDYIQLDADLFLKNRRLMTPEEFLTDLQTKFNVAVRWVKKLQDALREERARLLNQESDVLVANVSASSDRSFSSKQSETAEVLNAKELEMNNLRIQLQKLSNDYQALFDEFESFKAKTQRENEEREAANQKNEENDTLIKKLGQLEAANISLTNLLNVEFSKNTELHKENHTLLQELTRMLAQVHPNGSNSVRKESPNTSRVENAAEPTRLSLQGRDSVQLQPIALFDTKGVPSLVKNDRVYD